MRTPEQRERKESLTRLQWLRLPESPRIPVQPNPATQHRLAMAHRTRCGGSPEIYTRPGEVAALRPSAKKAHARDGTRIGQRSAIGCLIMIWPHGVHLLHVLQRRSSTVS